MNEFIVSTGSGNKVISSDSGSRGKSHKGSRKGGRYNDALQAHGVYHGHEDWEDAVFVPEDEALEQLEEIAAWEGKTVDALIAEMNKFRQESDGSRKGSRKGESGDTDEAHLFIYLYEQDTTDNNTLRNRWNALSDDEQEYILGQFGESRQDFEETFN